MNLDGSNGVLYGDDSQSESEDELFLFAAVAASLKFT